MRWPRIVAGLALVLAACSPSQPPPLEPTVEPPTANPTSPPRPVSPEEVAGDFLRLWQQGQYARMYDLLSSGAQATTPRELFVRRHTNIRDGIGETRLTAEQTDAATTSGEGEAAIVEVPIELRRSLAIFGEIAEPNALRLVQQRGAWHIDWDPGVLFTGLTASATVRVTPEQPTRGRIVDRAGEPLADNGSILAIGVVPGEIKDEAALLSALSEALNLSRETIKQRYQGGQPSWFMPIATRPQGDRAALESKFGAIGGVSLQSRPARVYPLGEAAAQLVGYVSHPTAEELKGAAVAGLDESDWIGRAGLEARAQPTLGGAKGGVIHIVDQAGRVLRTVAQKPAVAGQDLILELNSTVQRQAFEALAGQTGSVVVLDPRDNALRALVSVPSFDPNRFVVGLSDAEWQELNAPTRPLVLRASEAAYPTGSIFKPITMAAGLERGGFSPTQTFDCGRDWKGLPGQTLHNWEAQGSLTLTQALTQSCNPAFYEIGLSLDRMDPTLLPSYAKLFGLGQPTHAAGLFEVGGMVPTPEWKREQLRESWTSGDSVNLAIGQGYLLATPLQMANAYAALARGDGVVPPRLIAEPKPPRAEAGGLSISAGTRAAIIEGMKRVTSTPRGTAAYAFQGERLSIAAKTGSAENETPAAHAWFVGFTPAENASLLVVVMVEGGQQGGTVAAPIARKVIDFAYARKLAKSQLKPPTREALQTLLEALAPGGRVVRVRPLRGGVSSAVHAVRLEMADGTRRDVVVRRLNEYWQRTDPEHAAREFRLLEHLASIHLPVARPLWLDADGSIFGEPTIVMTRLPGRAVMAPRDVEDFMRKMANTLADVHRVPTDELAFLIRQRERVDRILTAEREVEDPLQRAVWDALKVEWQRVPQTPGSSLVHADYWPGNLLWRRDVLVGVVDWENPRLGDATEDLATLRREMWLLFGPPAAERLTRYYEEAGGQVRNLRFWDLWVSPEALEEMPDWLPGYHALGRADISLEYAVSSMRAFARAALEASPDGECGARARSR